MQTRVPRRRAGRLADASDKATLYKLGLTAFGLASLLVGMLSSVPAILVVRLLQGALTALVWVTGPARLADLVPPERRGRVYGSMISSNYMGLTLGPMVAAFWVLVSDARRAGDRAERRPARERGSISAPLRADAGV